MKKGINTWSFPQEMTLNEKLDLAIEAKFEGFEPALNKENEISLNSTEKDLIKVKKMACDKGITLTSLATSLHFEYPCTHNDLKIRNMSIEVIKKQIECAAILGIETILVVAGLTGRDVAPGSIYYDAAWDRALETFSTVANYAKTCNVKIGIENTWNKFLLSPKEMQMFLNELKRENIGVYLDVSNIMLYGYPEHWIRLLGDRILKLHMRDFKVNVPSS